MEDLVLINIVTKLESSIELVQPNCCFDFKGPFDTCI